MTAAPIYGLMAEFETPTELVEAAVSHMNSVAQLVELTTVPSAACRDAEDFPVLGTAIAGRSTILVTVDKDLLVVGTHGGVALIKPGEFWRRVRG